MKLVNSNLDMSHRFSLLINSLINLKDRVYFEVSQRRKLRFYRSNSLMLFSCTFHVHFSVVKLWFFRSNWQNYQHFKLESLRPLNRSDIPFPIQVGII